MYLAPLNYDRFFRKVFSDINIAKAFLEDFFDVTIEEIKKLDDKYRLTDDASTVEFDFRCKINGSYVIIDMQQWYKRDIGKRFYLYHAVNSSLQLEKLPEKKLPLDVMPQKRVKDYSALEPVITLIWMSVDNLDFKENYISYALAPEEVVTFLKKEDFWRNPDIKALLDERKRILEILNNKKKGIDFLPQNRLIFAFQGNIVRNKTHARYERWFTFASKSGYGENTESDFKEYKNDTIFKEIMHRLDKRELKPDEIEYMEQEKKFWLEMLQFDRSSYDEGIEEGFAQGEKKGKEDGRIEGKSEEKRNIARNMKFKNMNCDSISELTGLSIEEIEKL